MSNVINSNQYRFNDRLWMVNSTRSGLRTDILRVLLSQYDAFLKKHRKVFYFRFDLSVNDYTDDNKILANFIRRLSRKIKGHYGLELVYCWVRERESSDNQHYHFVLMLNGSKVRCPHKLQGWIHSIWEAFGRCSWSGYSNVKRDDYQAIQDATYHISYLAKTRSKSNKPIQTKCYGYSRNFL